MKKILSNESISRAISKMRKKDKKSIVVKNNLPYYMYLYDITVEDLAEKIGSTPNTINATISGKYVPSAYLCLLLSLCFDVPVNDLFYLAIVGGEEDEETI